MSELFSALKLSGAGMSVQRRKMNATAENIANAETTRAADGKPYRSKQVLVTGEPEQVGFGAALRRANTELTRTDPKHFQTHPKISAQQEQIITPQATEKSDGTRIRMVYDPSHPDADANGFVAMPDINIVVEMVNMMTAARAYEANATALDAAKKEYTAAMDI